MCHRLQYLFIFLKFFLYWVFLSLWKTFDLRVAPSLTAKCCEINSLYFLLIVFFVCSPQRSVACLFFSQWDSSVLCLIFVGM